jgi:AcrR family transcriptional regulator
MTASLPEPARGAAPKRQRGHDRVAAILRAATRLFLDKGYDAVTMTEIAASSGTAIGSLYRFFPSKDAVADALLRAYADLLGTQLAALGGRARTMTPAQLGEALVDMMLGLRLQRSVAIALVDARGLEDSRRLLRDAMLASLADLLRTVLPRLPEGRIVAMAGAVLLLLKNVAQMPDGGQEEQAVLAEWRRAVRAYLDAADANHG